MRYDRGDGGDNSSLSSNWDHTKNWKKMRDRQERIDKGLKSGRSLKSLWQPTESHSAGKGSNQRESNVSKEIYDLNYELAFGTITREEFNKRMKDLDAQD
jgi:hypothetical protein